jgi:hypothetical protein
MDVHYLLQRGLVGCCASLGVVGIISRYFFAARKLSNQAGRKVILLIAMEFS